MGLSPRTRSLRQVPQEWPLLVVDQERGPEPAPGPGEGLQLHDDRAWQWIPGRGSIEITREPLQLHFVTVEPLPDEAILHPYLGLPAIILANWQGRHSLHGGAFALSGRAWALLGDREAGKSSLLGAVTGRGASLVSDDVLITEGTSVFAGPRSIDLRQEAARVIGGDELPDAGNRPRWRMFPAPSEAVLPLAGFIHLGWGDGVQLRQLGADERLRLLIESSALRPDARAAMRLLDLASLPGWSFVRPRDLAALRAHAGLLLSELA